MISNELQKVSGGGKEHTRMEGGKKKNGSGKKEGRRKRAREGRAEVGDTGGDHYCFIKWKTSNRTHPGLNA